MVKQKKMIFPGKPVSMRWDKVEGQDYIVILNSKLEEILRVKKELWQHPTYPNLGFTAEMRDSIINECMVMYG